jgi:hypothetical protein
MIEKELTVDGGLLAGSAVAQKADRRQNDGLLAISGRNGLRRSCEFRCRRLQ